MDIKLVRRVAVAASNWHEAVAWCQETLYHGGHYEPKWHVQYPFIVFEDEQEYSMFLLRWT